LLKRKNIFRNIDKKMKKFSKLNILPLRVNGEVSIALTTRFFTGVGEPTIC